MLLDTIDFYHFIPLSLTWTLAGDHKVSAKQNLTHFSSDQDETWYGDKAIQVEHSKTNFEYGALKQGK